MSSNLPDILGSDSSFTTNIGVALRRSFQTANEQFLQIAEKQRLNDGSTGLCVIIRQDRLTVANVGDCRAVLLSNDYQRVAQLTIDQKPNSPKEKHRILSLGGFVQNCYGVFRVNGVLAVARAFGNRTLRQVIRPDAEITMRRLEREDDMIVIASDGLWDVLSNRDVMQICKSFVGQSQQRIANELSSAAIKRGSMDNVTVILINLSRYVSAMSRTQMSPSSSPVVDERPRQDFESPLSPSPSRPFNSNLAVTTNFANQSSDRASLRPVAMRANPDSYRQALIRTNPGTPTSAAISESNNEKNMKAAADSSALKRSINISSFDEFYNKQMASAKTSYTRNSYDNNGNSLSLATYSPYKQESSVGGRSISVDRSQLRRPQTADSISNSINKLNIIDEYPSSRLNTKMNDYISASSVRPSSSMHGVRVENRTSSAFRNSLK